MRLSLRVVQGVDSDERHSEDTIDRLVKPAIALGLGFILTSNFQDFICRSQRDQKMLEVALAPDGHERVENVNVVAARQPTIVWIAAHNPALFFFQLITMSAFTLEH